MTKAAFDKMHFDELVEWASENLEELTYEDTLISFAKQKLDDDNLLVAVHILNAIYNNPYDTELYLYNYDMGVLETPTPVISKEDFERLIDFDNEDVEEVNIKTNDANIKMDYKYNIGDTVQFKKQFSSTASCGLKEMAGKVVKVVDRRRYERACYMFEGFEDKGWFSEGTIKGKV